MEILRILRDHLPSMSDHQSFSVILDRVEGQIDSTEMNDDQIVVDCIELEGRYDLGFFHLTGRRTTSPRFRWLWKNDFSK